MTPIDLLGYAASATVLATFSMSTMTPLRVTNGCSPPRDAASKLTGAAAAM